MTSKLSFTIFGSKKVIDAKAALFMSEMGKVMGKTINGTMLIKLEREDGPERTLKQVKKNQLKQMFGPKNC